MTPARIAGLMAGAAAASLLIYELFSFSAKLRKEKHITPDIFISEKQEYVLRKAFPILDDLLGDKPGADGEYQARLCGIDCDGTYLVLSTGSRYVVNSFNVVGDVGSRITLFKRSGSEWIPVYDIIKSAYRSYTVEDALIVLSRKQGHVPLQ